VNSIELLFNRERKIANYKLETVSLLSCKGFSEGKEKKMSFAKLTLN
jgi:hypothetical protein